MDIKLIANRIDEIFSSINRLFPLAEEVMDNAIDYRVKTKFFFDFQDPVLLDGCRAVCKARYRWEWLADMIYGLKQAINVKGNDNSPFHYLGYLDRKKRFEYMHGHSGLTGVKPAVLFEKIMDKACGKASYPKLMYRVDGFDEIVYKNDSVVADHCNIPQSYNRTQLIDALRGKSIYQIIHPMFEGPIGTEAIFSGTYGAVIDMLYKLASISLQEDIIIEKQAAKYQKLWTLAKKVTKNFFTGATAFSSVVDAMPKSFRGLKAGFYGPLNFHIERIKAFSAYPSIGNYTLAYINFEDAKHNKASYVKKIFVKCHPEFVEYQIFSNMVHELIHYFQTHQKWIGLAISQEQYEGDDKDKHAYPVETKSDRINEAITEFLSRIICFNCKTAQALDGYSESEDEIFSGAYDTEINIFISLFGFYTDMYADDAVDERLVLMTQFHQALTTGAFNDTDVQHCCDWIVAAFSKEKWRHPVIANSLASKEPGKTHPERIQGFLFKFF